MRTYRLYFIDQRNGHIVDREVFDAMGDLDAIQTVAKLMIRGRWSCGMRADELNVGRVTVREIATTYSSRVTQTVPRFVRSHWPASLVTQGAGLLLLSLSLMR